MVSAELMKEKLLLVNSPQYLIEKQAQLDEFSRQTGQPRVKAQVDDYEFLKIMTETELQVTLMALLPILKIELVSRTKD